MMAVTIDKLVLDAKRISNRLSDRLVLGDSLINEIEFVNEQLKTCVKFEGLSELSRNKSNQNLANSIQKKYPHIQEIQHENRELRACLQDYVRTMEHVMTKYREHTQEKILNSKYTFTNAVSDDNSKHEQISHMVEVMRHTAGIDEEKEFAEMELINKLFTENQGLREMLEISKQFGSDKPVNDEETSLQTNLKEQSQPPNTIN